MNGELVIGQRYFLKKVERCMYFGIADLSLHDRVSEHHIFACRDYSETCLVYPIPTDRIEVDGEIVTAKNWEYPFFRQSKVELMIFCGASMKNGIKKGIEVKKG